MLTSTTALGFVVPIPTSLKVWIPTSFKTQKDEVTGKSVRFWPLIAGRTDGNLSSGTVPNPKLEAFKFVKFCPLIAGNGLGKFIVSIVPSIFEALISVKPIPEP